MEQEDTTKTQQLLLSRLWVVFPKNKVPKDITQHYKSLKLIVLVVGQSRELARMIYPCTDFDGFVIPASPMKLLFQKNPTLLFFGGVDEIIVGLTGIDGTCSLAQLQSTAILYARAKSDTLNKTFRIKLIIELHEPRGEIYLEFNPSKRKLGSNNADAGNELTPLSEFSPSDLKREYPALGQGSFAIVYKGSLKIGRKKKLVAIKDITLATLRSVDEWKQEVEMLSKGARCPYIVKVLGYVSAPKCVCIVMELAAHGSLYHLLHVNPTPEFTRRLRVRAARHVAYSVAYLESVKVLHRDIKSLNYLVTEDWTCKLSDFGTAKLLPENAQHTLLHTSSVGSPLWMSPEVRTGQKYGLEADVYSMGVVLYEIFEEKLPDYDMQLSRIVWPAAVAFPSAPLVLALVLDDPKARAKAYDAALYLDHLLALVKDNTDDRAVQLKCAEFFGKTQLKDVPQLQRETNARTLEEMLVRAATPAAATERK